MSDTLAPLPANTAEFSSRPWGAIAPYYDELAARPLTAATIDSWLADWTQLENLVSETYSRLRVAVTVDTTDVVAEEQYIRFLEEIRPRAAAAGQQLKQRLLAAGLEPDNFEIPLRNMRAEAELFREANLPLITAESKLASEYNKVIGGQTVEWEDEELTLTQLGAHFHTPDREVRERIWRLAAARRLADRETLNRLWVEMLAVRRRLAANSGLPDYRAYRWLDLLRFDYAPGDSQQFHQAIEDVVVPAASRVYERQAQRLNVASLRPWDLDADVFSLALPALRPFDDTAQLEQNVAAILHCVDSQLGQYFDVMREEALLDLPNRKGKAPGGYCTSFAVAQRPFIFMNAVGLHGDVKTLLHEAGHAFHVFEKRHLPYTQQHRVTSEFAEVASMAMELLAAPYLPVSKGGFYTEEAAIRARIQHLEKILLFWPYMAVVDAFQHWAYTVPEAAVNPDNCDAQWCALWQRFLPGIEWSGYEAVLATGWHRKQHIFRAPFYYVEYGMAQLGALQIWRNALADQPAAVADYRRALALGGTRPLPALYEAAGARFVFNHETVQEAVALIEETIAGWLGR